MSTTITLESPLRTGSVRTGSARAAGASRTQGGHVRLTRRGRVVVFALALVIALAVGIALGGGSSASEEVGQYDATQLVVVNEGDTLWGIASDAADGGDVREMMAAIEELNGLESPVLDLGQELHVPVAD